jgi:hypothetical protein
LLAIIVAAGVHEDPDEEVGMEEGNKGDMEPGYEASNMDH